VSASAPCLQVSGLAGPSSIWVGGSASFSLPAYLELKAHLGLGAGLTDETVTLLNTVGRFDERVLEHFGVPFRRLYLRPASTFKLEVARDGCFYDKWGVKYMPRGPVQCGWTGARGTPPENVVVAAYEAAQSYPMT